MKSAPKVKEQPRGSGYTGAAGMTFGAHIRQRTSFVLTFLLSLCIIIVYWRVFKYPYIQDDWFVLGEITKLGDVNFIVNKLGGADGNFYRPLGSLYCLFVYKVFDVNSVGFHLFTLAIHACTSLLIAYIVFECTHDGVISWVTAFLYATAITIHIDSLLWMVGIYDIGGAFLFFLSFAWFIKNRTKLSVLAFGLALLMKESTIVLPAILFLYAFVAQHQWKPIQSNIRKIFVGLLPHFSIIVIYGLFRSRWLFVSLHAEENPYSIRFIGAHVIENLGRYGKWCLESVLPEYGIPVASLILLLGLLGFVYIWRKGDIHSVRNVLFSGGWLLLGLLPVVFMPNHFFRYYLTYSLAAYVVILVLSFRFSASLFKMKESVFRYLMVAFVAISVVMSSMYFTRLDDLGMDAPEIDGSNNLIRKGYYVTAVRSTLLTQIPALPIGATLLFDKLPTVSFGCNAGPRMWYNDTTINVYEAIKAPAGVYLHDPLLPDDDAHQAIHIDPQSSFMFTLDGRKARIVRLSEETD